MTVRRHRRQNMTDPGSYDSGLQEQHSLYLGRSGRNEKIKMHG